MTTDHPTIPKSLPTLHMSTSSSCEKAHLPTPKVMAERKTANLLQPKTPNNVRDKIIKKKNKQKIYYNRGTKDLRPLKTGDIVRVHPLPTDKQGRWFKVRVEGGKQTFAHMSSERRVDKNTEGIENTCGRQRKQSKTRSLGKTMRKTNQGSGSKAKHRHKEWKGQLRTTQIRKQSQEDRHNQQSHIHLEKVAEKQNCLVI